MSFNRDNYRKEVNQYGPEVGWTFSRFFRYVMLPIIGLSIALGIIGYALGWFSEAAQVTQEEFGPRAALNKYEWFVDINEAINKMDQDIMLFENRYSTIESDYKNNYGTDPASWPPDIRTTYNRERQTGRDDLLAVTSQRNNLAKEYNAASEKFNWLPFRDEPDLPPERLEEYVSNI